MNKEYLQYRAADFLSQTVPRRFAYWIGLRVADAFYRRDERGRSAVMANLRQILSFRGLRPSEETLERLARQTFQHFGKYLVDFFRFTRISRRQISRIITWEHPEYLERTVAEKRGSLIVGAHLGNWETAGAVIGAMGYPVNAVVLPHPNKKTEALFQSRRQKRGFHLIPLGHAAQGILRALRRTEVVAMLADRDYGPHEDAAIFFGAQARLPRGAAVLSVKTGAPVLPAFLLRQPDDTFLFRFHEPIMPDGQLSIDDVQDRIRTILEREIAANPTQWFMFDHFWRRWENGKDRPPANGVRGNGDRLAAVT
jgi:KDO2-lipid IV(A) lauroyltransferase